MTSVLSILSKKIGLSRVAFGNVVMITALLLYVVADAVCKGLLVNYTPYQVVFFRTLARLIPIVAICFINNNNPFKTIRMKEHLFRAVIASMNTFFFIAAYKYSPMTDVHTIGYTTAIFMLPFSYFILKEKVHSNIILAVFIGLLGVVLVLRPSSSVDSYLHIGAIFALLGAIFSALNSVLIRRLTSTESLYTIIFFHNFVLFFISLFFSISYWIPIIDVNSFVICFLVISVLGTLAQYLISFAFSITKASELAVTSYIIIVPVMLIDIFVWNLQPDKFIILGLLLIVLCNYFVIKGQKNNG